MESKVFLSFLVAMLLSTAATAETYRWKDQLGGLHFGSVVPAEYADQPYDIISKSGLVIGHVDPDSQNPEVKAAAEKLKAETAQSLAERQAQSDRLLLIKYPTEDALLNAMQLEIDQVGYDNMLITQSYTNTNTAVIDKVRLAADQQRAGIKVSDAQIREFARMYRDLSVDKKKLSTIGSREGEVRAEFAAELQRYRDLVEKYNNPAGIQATKQKLSTAAEPELKDQS